MKVITLGKIEFLSNENTIEVMGEIGGLFFCAYYTPTSYYKSIVFSKDGLLVQHTDKETPDIKLYKITDLMKSIK